MQRMHLNFEYLSTANFILIMYFIMFIMYKHNEIIFIHAKEINKCFLIILFLRTHLTLYILGSLLIDSH